MRTHQTVLRLTCILGLLLAIQFSVGAQTPTSQLNVLFLIADDLNCDLHAYGHPRVQSPNIDRLAARGVRFERAYCQFPLCSPSRSSFLTGRRPNVTRVLANPGSGRFSTDYRPNTHFRDFLPYTVTLPQLFRQNGYFVARVGKLYHYGVPGQIGTSGLDDLASWEYVVNPAGRDKAEENRVFSLIPGSYGGTLSWMATEGSELEHTDGLSATAAISLLEQHKDKPFFLAVGMYRPHTPYVAPKKYFDLYPPAGVPLPQLSTDDQKRLPEAAYLSAKKEQESMTDQQRREAIQAYWASITFMDAQIGRVLGALDRLGLSRNTVVVMTSDHGYHLAEHGLWQKQSLFENSARVPLVVAAPGAAANGRSTSALAELVDLYPTLADLCGLTAPKYLDGKSLKPALADPQARIKEAAYTQVRRGRYDGYSIRTERWRYTLWDGGEKGEQLFDMQSDLGETRNLAHEAQLQPVVAELKQKVLIYSGSTP